MDSQGEWLEYTINVANNGNYNLETRVAYAGTGGTFHIEFNGVDKTGPIIVPDTGSYQTWTTLKKTVSLSAGQQVMKIVMDKIGDNNIGNINYIRITSTTTTPTPTPIPTHLQPLHQLYRELSMWQLTATMPILEQNPNHGLLQKAANTLTAGQTVYVKSGTCNEKITIETQEAQENA